MKRLILTSGLLFLIMIPVASQAQIGLDVKTSFEDKSKLMAVKSAVITAIDGSKKFVRKEFGEDYSLWLKNIQRSSYSYNDSVYVSIDVEIRTAAMVTRGDLLASGTLPIAYHPNQVAKNIDDLNVMAASMLQSTSANFNMLKKAAPLLDTIYPGSSVFLNGMLNVFKKENMQPEPYEFLEGTLLGSSLIIELNNFLIDN